MPTEKISFSGLFLLPIIFSAFHGLYMEDIVYFRERMIAMMTHEEKDEIRRLQGQGFGYRRIAAITGLSVDAVKSYCARNLPETKINTCMECGKVLTQIPHRKAKKFCSDACRQRWWGHNRNKGLNLKYSFVCPECGKAFHSSKANRVYCSRKCFANARRKVVSE